MVLRNTIVRVGAAALLWVLAGQYPVMAEADVDVHSRWVAAQHQWTPEVQSAFLSQVRRETIANLAALRIAFPAGFLQWIDFQRMLLAGLAAATAAEPANLAPQARVSASTEHSAPHLARFAVDGKVPARDSKRDTYAAWCTRGAMEGGSGEFTLEWPEVVSVAEVVYWGRTAMIATEVFKDYELYLDDAAAPVVKGAFEMRHGPQRISLAVPTQVRKVRLRFLRSYGGPNPGASQIAVYPARPTDVQLGRFPLKASPLEAELHAGKLGFRQIAVVKRQHLATSHVYTYHAEGFKPGGGLYVATVDRQGNTTLRQLVDASEGMILSCDVSYCGNEILFSWKRQGAVASQWLSYSPIEHCRSNPTENYHIFRIHVDGTGLTQLTDGPHHNLDAVWLPDGGIAFISDRTPAYAYCFVSTSPVLYRMERDGSAQRQLSFNYLMDFTPAALEDGRILFTRWEYVDRPACPIQSLWTINPDGSGLAGFFGNRVLEPGTFMQAQQIPNTRKVLALLTAHNGDPRGAIGIIDVSQGGNAQEAIRNLTPEIDIGRVDQGTGNLLVNRGPYESPFPVSDRCWLVSNDGNVELRSYDLGVAATSVLVKDGILGYYYPRPIMPRAKPPEVVSVLPENPEPFATVIMTDVYRGLEGYVQRGEIAQIAVVEELPKNTFTPLFLEVPGFKGYAANSAFGFQFPLISCGATYAPKRILGYADVSEDGSASFKVPASLPVHFMPLDRQGRALQRMRTFTHFMPGERQSCVGCHADRNYAAPPPSRLAHPHSMDEPQELQPPEWGVKGFSYREIVQPVLDRHCIQCHNAHNAPSGVDLSGDMTDFFNVSYDILARKGTLGEWRYTQRGVGAASRQEGRSPYTSWISTINGAEYNILLIEPKAWGSPASKLADIVLSGHPDAQGNKRVDVDEAGKRRIMAWIDLNVPYYPNSRATYPQTIGCRRLHPEALNSTLARVAEERCTSCHDKGLPRQFFVRVEKPERNSFLLAPLAQSAGGTEACGRAVFASKNDPDYQAILKTFEPVREIMREQPRDDMLPACADGAACQVR